LQAVHVYSVNGVSLKKKKKKRREEERSAAHLQIQQAQGDILSLLLFNAFSRFREYQKD
jgi:hypothetical protein